jgi:hypothetical protein
VKTNALKGDACHGSNLIWTTVTIIRSGEAETERGGCRSVSHNGREDAEEGEWVFECLLFLLKRPRGGGR